MICCTAMTPMQIQLLRRLTPVHLALWDSLVLAPEHVAVLFQDEESSTILAAGGIHQHAGIGYPWLVKIATPEVLGTYGVRLVQIIRQAFLEAYLKHGYRRLEARTATDSPKDWRLLHVLGFRREGECRCYFEDESNAYLYSWINEMP